MAQIRVTPKELGPSSWTDIAGCSCVQRIRVFEISPLLLRRTGHLGGSCRSTALMKLSIAMSLAGAVRGVSPLTGSSADSMVVPPAGEPSSSGTPMIRIRRIEEMIDDVAEQICQSGKPLKTVHNPTNLKASSSRRLTQYAMIGVRWPAARCVRRRKPTHCQNRPIRRFNAPGMGLRQALLMPPGATAPTRKIGRRYRGKEGCRGFHQAGHTLDDIDRQHHRLGGGGGNTYANARKAASRRNEDALTDNWPIGTQRSRA